MRQWIQAIFITTLSLVFVFGCEGGDRGSGGLLPTDEASITVTGENLAAPDGLDFKALAFNQSVLFYLPDAVASGASTIESGASVAPLPTEMNDGIYYVYAYIDSDPSDGDRPMQGDWLAGPVELTVADGVGNVTLDGADFVPVNVLARVECSDPAAEGAEVRIRVGMPTTPCQAAFTDDVFGVIESGEAVVGIAGLPDGTYSVCALIDLDPTLPVTSLPAGADLVAADGTGLMVVDGAGEAILPESAFHAIPALFIDLSESAGKKLPEIPDGTTVVVSMMSPGMLPPTASRVDMPLPSAFGAGQFTGGQATVALIFWLLDGPHLTFVMIDADSSGPMGVTLGDMIGAQMVNVAAELVLPPMGTGDFFVVNVLAHIELDGHDGEMLSMGIYPDGSFCSGLPLAQSLMPSALSDGAATIPLFGLPDGDYEACPLVDVDSSASPSPGDLTALHRFTLSGEVEFTIVETEFFPIMP